MNDYSNLQTALGHRFADEFLLAQAMIHPSARHEKHLAADNQRMEHFGDAVLGLAAAEYLYRLNKELDEGQMTMLRSSVTSTAFLAGLARKLDLGRYVELGRGEEVGGGRSKDRILADAMEAVMAACYLDGGMNAVRAVFTRWFVPAMTEQERMLPEDNPKGRLQEWAQQSGLPCPEYKVIKEEGPSHQRWFTVEVRIRDQFAHGSSTSKRAAEVAAARELWNRRQSDSNHHDKSP